MHYPISDPGSKLHNGKFTDGIPAQNVDPSLDKATHYNAVYDEIINAIIALGETPAEGTNDQLAAGLEALIDSIGLMGNEINLYWDDSNGVQKNLVLGTSSEAVYGQYAIKVGHTSYEGFGISSITSAPSTAGYFQGEGGGSLYPTLNVINNGNSSQFDRGISSIARTAIYASGTGLGSTGVSSGATSDGYDFYARGSGTNYGPFTGAHDAVINKNATLPAEGDIVKSIGICCRSSISNVLAEIELQDSSEAKNSFGVMVYSIELADENNVSAMSNLTDSEYLNIRATHNKAAINGVGEGQINVCDEGGNIEIGDFITTSSVAGKGKNYAGADMRVVVARALEPVDWSQEAGTQKQIACIYLCG